MIKKKYFVLTAVLLVGVVLLSGCMGGGSDDIIDDGSNETEEVVEQAEIQSTFESAITEIENQNIEEAKLFFSKQFVYDKYYDGWKEMKLDEFLNNLISDSLNSIDILKFNLISDNRYEMILKINSSETEYFKGEIAFEKLDGEYYISNIEDILPQEEISHMETLSATLNQTDKEKFIELFVSEGIEIYSDDPEITNIDNAEDLYIHITQNNTIEETKFELIEYSIPANDTVNIAGNLFATINGSEEEVYIDSNIHYNEDDDKLEIVKFYFGQN